MTQTLANALIFAGFSGAFLLMVWISSLVEAYWKCRRKHEDDDARQPQPVDRL